MRPDEQEFMNYLQRRLRIAEFLVDNHGRLVELRKSTVAPYIIVHPYDAYRLRSQVGKMDNVVEDVLIPKGFALALDTPWPFRGDLPTVEAISGSEEPNEYLDAPLPE